MANIVKRHVKGKEYFYLEQNIRFGKKVKTLSVYLGKEKPIGRFSRKKKKH